MADIRGLIGVTPGNAKGRGTESGGLVLALVISVASCVMFGLSLVWVTNERTDMGYSVLELRRDVEIREAYRAKLEVERERLLAPQILDKKAREMGLRDAKPGQIRRMDAPGSGNAAR